MGEVSRSTPDSSGPLHQIDVTHAHLATPAEAAPPREAEPLAQPAEVRSGTLTGTYSTPHAVTYASSSGQSSIGAVAVGVMRNVSSTTPSSSSSSSSSTMGTHGVSVGSSSSSSSSVAVPEARLLSDMNRSVKGIVQRNHAEQTLRGDIQSRVSVLAPRLSPEQRNAVVSYEKDLSRLTNEQQALQSTRRAAPSEETSSNALQRMQKRIEGAEQTLAMQQRICEGKEGALVALRKKYKVTSDSDPAILKLSTRKQQEFAKAKAEWRTELARLSPLRQSLAGKIETKARLERGEISAQEALGGVGVVDHRLSVLPGRIAETQGRLNTIEHGLREGLDHEHAAILDDQRTMGTMRHELAEHQAAIREEANHFEALGLELMAMPPDTRQEHIQHIADQFLRAGIWPPRGDRPFSEFRQLVVQQMLTTALAQHPPQFLGQESSGGVYLVFANVDTVVDGQVVSQPRPIGVFKPDDEAPGGAYAHIPEQEVQPGLAPETASMRQALISQLGGRNTVDSMLVQAGHRDFKYWGGDSRTRGEDGEWERVSPEAYAERNSAALGDRIGAPPLKEGIFIAYVPQAQTMAKATRDGAYNPAMLDNSIWDRVYEDVAFGNWDPNDGNQLLAASSEGSLAGSTAWHQIDLDKGLPAGFIAASNAPLWGTAEMPQSQERIPPALAERILQRDVEQEIAQARTCWTQMLDARAARIANSDMPEPQKQEALARLDQNRWSESQSTVLRVQDQVLKAAVRDGHTMGEIRQIFLAERGAPSDLSPATVEDMAYRFGVPDAQAHEFTADLHEFNFQGTGTLDIPNYMVNSYLKAKAAAMTDPAVVRELDPAKRQQLTRELTMAHFEKELSNPKLWAPS